MVFLGALKSFKDYLQVLSNEKTNISIKLEKQYAQLFRHEIDDYKSARTLRYDPNYPKTYKLQSLYQDAVKGDAHLRGAMGNRVLRVTNRRYVIRDPDGLIDVERTKWIQKRWFKKTIRLALSSIFYGYSLIWPSAFDKDGKIKDVKLIPRGHCIPETGDILVNPLDDSGLKYHEVPEQIWVAELGEDTIGLLETASALTIFKRHSWASWDQWEQLFGQPLRIAYTTGDKTHETRVAAWLKNLGKAAFAVFRKDVDKVELVESKRADAYQVFDKKRQAINEENSKLINGQTMTVDSGSSRSQSEVHLKTQDEITKDDNDNTKLWLNDTLKPALQYFGYDIPEGYTIDQEEISLASEKIKIDKELMTGGVRLSRQYLESTYDVELEDEETIEDQGGSSAKKSLSHSVSRVTSLIALAKLYEPYADHDLMKADDLVNLDIGRMVTQVLVGRLTSGVIEEQSFRSYYEVLTKAVREGFGKASAPLGSANEKVLQQIRYNVATFGAFKNHSFVNQLTRLLIDEDGKRRTKRDFIRRATALDKTYNKRWFGVEYDLVYSKANSAVRWNAFQERKHLYPNVQRREVIDGRTRSHHIPLNGVVVSLDDDFLNTHWAPDEPGCRGTMIQTDKEIDHKDQNLEDYQKELTPWNINPGKFGKVVDQTHPYFQVSKTSLNKIAKRANAAVLQEQQREVLHFFKNKKLSAVTTDNRKVSVTAAHAKSVMKQSLETETEWYRNELLFNIDEVIKQADFVETITTDGTIYHNYEITIHDRLWTIVFKEDNGIVLNSIR